MTEPNNRPDLDGYLILAAIVLFVILVFLLTLPH